MSDEKENKQSDVVSRDKYNEVIEAHNSVKLEKEKLQKELADIKKIQDKENDKKEWKIENDEVKKEIEELKKSINEKKDETKVAKGIVTEPKQENNMVNITGLKSKLDEVIPTDQIKDVRNLSPIQRYGYFKAPTKRFSTEQFGRVLSLDAGRHNSGQAEVSNFARKNANDIVVYANSKILNG